MLVLSRKENESIIINNQIEVKIVSIKPDQVKIGIIAPKHVKIFRQEIFDEIVKENKQAQVSNVLFELKRISDERDRKNKRD
ncbi:MAG: carbon storage regulator CsrA [Brevinemataceae bacterium]